MPQLITRDLLPMKLHYLFFYGGIAPVVLFMSTYAKQLGFSPDFGSIYSVLSIVGIFSKLLMGIVADKFQIHQFILLVFISICLLNFFVLIFIPSVNNKTAVATLNCNKTTTVLEVCSPQMSIIDGIMKDSQKELEINRNINCNLTCSVNTVFLNSICTSWEMPYYCSNKIKTGNQYYYNLLNFMDSSQHTNEIGKNSKFPYENIVQFVPPNQLSLFLNDSAKSVSVKFNALLSSDDITQHSPECVYLKMPKVKSIIDNINVGKTSGHEENWHLPYCDSVQRSQCDIVCDDISLTSVGTPHENFNPSLHYRIWLFVVLLILGWIGLTVVTTVGDTICFGLLGDNFHEYGKQRLWGSIGWGLCALAVGFLIDYFSIEKENKDFTPLFYFVAVLLSLDLLVTTCIKDKQRTNIYSASIVRDVGKLFVNFKIFLFFVWCILVGICTCSIWNLLFWKLEDLAGSNKRWITTLGGLQVGIRSFGGELPFFFLNSWLLKKFGHVNCMSLVLLGFGVKFILYSLLVNPWWFLLIELLSGILFSTLCATMTSYASTIAPRGAEATTQGIVGALYEGVGISLGSLIGGFLLHNYNSVFVFKMYGIVTLVICFLHIVIHKYIQMRAVIQEDSVSLNSSQDSFVANVDEDFVPNGFRSIFT